MRMHALVVDDDPTVRALLMRRLLSEGLSADVAAGSAEAIELLQKRSYSVMLLDWLMPDGGGHAVLDFIKGSPVRHVDTVIVITGAELQALTTIDRTVVKSVMFKPLNPAAIVAHVKELLA